MYCPKCGDELLSHQKFCRSCGYENPAYTGKKSERFMPIFPALLVAVATIAYALTGVILLLPLLSNLADAASIVSAQDPVSAAGQSTVLILVGLIPSTLALSFVCLSVRLFLTRDSSLLGYGVVRQIILLVFCVAITIGCVLIDHLATKRGINSGTISFLLSIYERPFVIALVTVTAATALLHVARNSVSKSKASGGVIQ